MSDMNQPPPPPPPPPGGGTPPPPPPGSVPGAASLYPKNWMGITALIAGIVGFLLICCGGLGFLPAVGAVVLGILGRKAAQEGEANNSGMAMAGLILGAASLLLNLAMFILGFLLGIVDIGLL